ncbi:MAG: adenylosuccinate synthase [Anaerolineaceae bacterium]|nr:adenylosuccinate synthase [Anaerolineaceae bacterium]
MALQIIVGMQWGDEGKGRFVDLLSKDAQIAARYNGGDNAGHTIRINDDVYKLHLIPSGIIYPQTIGVMGNGMVINPQILINEIRELRDAGIEINPSRLKISYAAHMITPAHRALDLAREAHLGDAKIGTTGRGIGPAYADKAHRIGVRYLDMLKPDLFKEKVTHILNETNHILVNLYNSEPVDVQKIVKEYLEYASILTPYIADTSKIVSDALNEDQLVIGEGAQGAMLDIDYGTYPYNTSSSCLSTGAMTGLGIAIPKDVQVYGIAKVFQTRVGSGAFPTELFDEQALRLRGDGSQQWDEFGTTTGRPRRVGWLDLVLLREICRLNGVNALALTKMDVLSGISSFDACVGYGTTASPVSPLIVDESTAPEYQTFDGWQEDIGEVRQWQDLPEAARTYVTFIEKFVDVPVKWISVGPERNSLITR